MMRARFTEALKEAMRSRDETAISTIRLILAAIKDRDIAARSSGNMDGIDDSQIFDLLKKMTKQREESIALYEQGGRLDLVEQERSEIAVINRFLPEQMGDRETEEAVAAVVGEIGAAGIKDMGRVMAELRARYPGRMDFGKASAAAKRPLSG